EVSGQIRDSFGQSLGEDARLTFQVGPAEPLLFGPEQILVTLDPWARKPIFSVYAINYDHLDVKIYAVQPYDWPAFQKYLQDYQRTDSPPSPPGRLMLNEAMPVETQPDSLVEVGIDLSQYMDGDFGHFIVIVTPPRALFKPQDYWQTVNAWVQVTQIGLDAFTDHSEMVAWTTALKDGAPLPGVTIAAGGSGEQAITAEDGTARFPIPEGATYLVGRLGVDQVLLPRFASYWVEEGWRSQTIRDDLRWYVFDDRQMYRPGEDLHLKGWLRRVGGGQYGDVGLVAGSVDSVNYRVTDPQGNELLNGRSEVNTLGGFDLSFTLPEETNLGYAQIEFTAEGDLSGFSGSQFYHSFQIQEFRRPEFEVSARNETPGPYFAGSPATVAVQASYYAGGPLPNAEVNWQVSSTPSSYAPPNWPDFIFGKWQPWWWFGPFSAEMPGGPWPGSGETIYEGFSGFTDATGTHYLRLDFDQFPEPQPYSTLAEANVIDVNRQAWTGSTTLLVHPADLYVGLRSQRMFVERGTPLEIDMIVTDLDGNLIPGNLVEVRAARLEWKYRGGEWGEEEVDPQVCSLVSEAEPLSCSFETPLGGEYRITAVVADGQGRQNQTQLTRWVSGGQRPPSRKVELETLTLIPDKEIYQPGDVAQILVQPPFTPAEGLLTVSRSGILYTQPFHLEGNSITLEVPVEQAHIPNLNVQVDLVGSAPRVDDRGEPLTDAPPRPAYASGSLNLDIPPLERTLSLQVAPAEPELEPGGETLINLQLIDSQGRPVPSAEVAVVVVDEAVLALSSYQLSDPLEIFYAVRQSDTNASYGRASLVLVDPLSLIGEAAVGNVLQKVETELAVMESAPMEAPAAAMPTMTAQAMDAGSRQSSADPAIRMRSDFNPLALFAPIVRTGADGVPGPTGESGATG
ncbi:MAG: MG2 domain-containing protein, partial [Anaerolineales bacterium]